MLAGRAQTAEVEFLLGLSQPELMDRVKREAADTIVLYLAQFRDRDGRPYMPREVLRAISAVSPAPIYGPYRDLRGLRRGGWSRGILRRPRAHCRRTHNRRRQQAHHRPRPS